MPKLRLQIARQPLEQLPIPLVPLAPRPPDLHPWNLQASSAGEIVAALRRLHSDHHRDVQRELSALEAHLREACNLSAGGPTSARADSRDSFKPSYPSENERVSPRRVSFRAPTRKSEADSDAEHDERIMLLAHAPSRISINGAYNAAIVNRWRHVVAGCFAMAALAFPWSLSRAIADSAPVADRAPSPSRESRRSRLSVISAEIGDIAGTLHHRWRQYGNAVTGCPDHIISTCRWAGVCRVQHPRSRARIFWDVLGAILILFSLITFPLRIFDLANFEGALTVHGIISCVFWSFDIALSLNLGFYNSHGELQLDRKRIARRYFAKFFVFDFTVTVVEWIAVLNIIDLSFSFQWLRLLRLFRFTNIVLGLARMAKRDVSARMAHRMKGNWLADILNASISVALPNFVFLVSVHYVACGWYWVCTRHGSGEDIGPHGEDFLATYLTAFWWAISQSTLLTTDIFPETASQRAFAIAAMMFLTVPLACVVISVAGAASEFLECKGRNEMDELHEFFREYNISSMLRERSEDIILQRTIRGSKLVHDVQLLSMLPAQEVRMLKQEAFMRTLRNHPLLSLLEEYDSVLVNDICNGVVTEQCVVIHQVVAAANESLHQMVFVECGCLHLLEDTLHGRRLATAKTHEWAGELALWCDEVELQGPLVAGSSLCKLLGVEVGAFRELASRSGPSFHLLAIYGQIIINHFNARARVDEGALGLFNDRGHIDSVASDASRKYGLQLVLKGTRLSRHSRRMAGVGDASFSFLVCSTPRWSSISGEEPFDIDAMARIQRAARQRRNLQVAYDFPGSSTADPRDFSPGDEAFMKASGGKRGTALPGMQVDWKSIDSVAASHWFQSYKAQVKAALKVKCQQHDVRRVVVLAIRGGPVCQLEQRECIKIVQEAIADNKKLGIQKAVEFRVIDFREFVSDFETA